MKLAEESALEIDHIQVAKGTIATGDSFMNDPGRVAFVREKFPELYAVEMEAALVAQVCQLFERHLLSFERYLILQGKNPMSHLINFLSKRRFTQPTLSCV